MFPTTRFLGIKHGRKSSSDCQRTRSHDQSIFSTEGCSTNLDRYTISRQKLKEWKLARLRKVQLRIVLIIIQNISHNPARWLSFVLLNCLRHRTRIKHQICFYLPIRCFLFSHCAGVAAFLCLILCACFWMFAGSWRHTLPQRQSWMRSLAVRPRTRMYAPTLCFSAPFQTQVAFVNQEYCFLSCIVLFKVPGHTISHMHLIYELCSTPAVASFARVMYSNRHT